jgi:hypothetical protein
VKSLWDILPLTQFQGFFDQTSLAAKLRPALGSFSPFQVGNIDYQTMPRLKLIKLLK